MTRRVLASLLVFVAMAAPVRAQSTDKHFLWSVRQGDGPPTYLVGSIHMLTKDFYPLKPAFEKAFTGSKVLIEEVDLDELTNPTNAMAILGRAMFADGRTLDMVIAPDLYKQVVARAEKAGIPQIVVQRMKPWMVSLALVAPVLKQAGFDPELGIDKYFFDKAKKAGMERRALETVAYQLDRFDQMPLPIQEGMLKAVIADLDTQLGNVKTIAEAWSAGNTATLEALLLGSFMESPELYDRLLVERNRNWVQHVDKCLAEKTACYIVVGAAHLVGPHSLVALLEKKGYKVEQH